MTVGASGVLFVIEIKISPLRNALDAARIAKNEVQLKVALDALSDLIDDLDKFAGQVREKISAEVAAEEITKLP